MSSSPPGTYLPPGSTTPVVDPGGTYSGDNASAPTVDPAGTYSSPYALNWVFIEWENIVPEGSVLSFTSETQVANYFGVGSVEDLEAETYFAGYQGVTGPDGPPTMDLTRDPIGQRPHVLGGNLGSDSLSELQAISGSLALTFDGFNYSANINLSNLTGTVPEAINEAAKEI